MDNNINCITVNFDRTQHGISTIHNFIISMKLDHMLIVAHLYSGRPDPEIIIIISIHAFHYIKYLFRESTSVWVSTSFDFEASLKTHLFASFFFSSDKKRQTQ